MRALPTFKQNILAAFLYNPHSQKTMSIILVLAIIVIGIVTIGNCINVTLASTNLPSELPGQRPSSLSPPSQPSSPSPNIERPTEEVNPASVGNYTTPAENNTTIGPFSQPIIVGPSSFTASPITDENQINENTTPITPTNSSSLGIPAQ